MDVLATILQVIGAGLVVIALGLVDYRLGIGTAGLMLLFVGFALEYTDMFREPEDDEHGTAPSDAHDAEGHA